MCLNSNIAEVCSLWLDQQYNIGQPSEFENVICKMSAILFMLQYVKVYTFVTPVSSLLDQVGNFSKYIEHIVLVHVVKALYAIECITFDL